MPEPSEMSLDQIVARFDAVRIPDPTNPEVIVGRVGLVVTLYLPADPELAYRERLGALADAVVDRFAGSFRWRTEVVGPDDLRVRPLPGGGRFAEAARRLGAHALFAGMAGSSPADADNPESVPGSHQIQFFVPGAGRPGESGHLRLSLPFTWERDTDGPALLTLTRQLCTALSPLHGSAGMGFVYPVAYADAYDAGTEGAFHAAVHRFPGIDATPPLTGEGEADALPTLNWLTCLGRRILDRLGGQDAIIRQLAGEPFETYPYSGGLLIRAGSAPLPGDRNQSVVPSPYRQLYRILKPVIMTTVENPFVLDGINDDEEAQFTAYVRRFE